MIETWRHVSQSDIDEWRKKVKNNVATKRGTRWEYNTAYHTGWERGTPEEAKTGVATITAPKTATGIRQHRDTAEEAAKSMVAWVRESKDQFIHRVRILKRAGNLAHLTDEQAAEQLWQICRKIAEADSKRVYARDGYDKRFWTDPIGG